MKTKIEKVRMIRKYKNYQKRPIEREWVVFYKSGRVRKYTDFIKLPWTVFLYITHPDIKIIESATGFGKGKEAMKIEVVKVREG